MAQTYAKPTDFNRALGDAKKQAGDVADAVTDAAQDVYGQARESAADVVFASGPRAVMRRKMTFTRATSSRGLKGLVT